MRRSRKAVSRGARTIAAGLSAIAKGLTTVDTGTRLVVDEGGSTSLNRASANLRRKVMVALDGFQRETSDITG